MDSTISEFLNDNDIKYVTNFCKPTVKDKTVTYNLAKHGARRVRDAIKMSVQVVALYHYDITLRYIVSNRLAFSTYEIDQTQDQDCILGDKDSETEWEWILAPVESNPHSGTLMGGAIASGMGLSHNHPGFTVTVTPDKTATTLTVVPRRQDACV